MKVLLQSEAKTISDREIAENQAYLLNILLKIKQSIFPKRRNKSRLIPDCQAK